MYGDHFFVMRTCTRIKTMADHVSFCVLCCWGPMVDMIEHTRIIVIQIKGPDNLVLTINYNRLIFAHMYNISLSLAKGNLLK